MGKILIFLKFQVVKLLVIQQPLPRHDCIDFIDQNVFKIEFGDGDILKPKCLINEKFLKEL